MNKFLISIKNSCGYLYKLDENDLPIKPVVVESKSILDAIDKLSDINYCKKIGIDECFLFESYILKMI